MTEINADDFHQFLRRAYVINEPMDGELNFPKEILVLQYLSGNSYLSLLKCADYFSSDQILNEAENFIIAHCCPEKWQAKLVFYVWLKYLKTLSKTKKNKKNKKVKLQQEEREEAIRH